MTINPSMLTVARESRGLTKSALAEAIGVTAGHISKIEDGFSTPSAHVVDAMADALGYPRAFLEQLDSGVGIDSPCLYHRKRKTLPLRDLRRVEAQMHATRVQLRGMLRDLVFDTPYSMHTLDPDELGSPERVAQALRGAWGLRRGPIANLSEIIEAAGGVIVHADFGHHKLDGLSCWEKAGPPLFYLNRTRPAENLRFTLAHELGHLTMHHFPSTDLEGEADRFAAEFLMPASEIRGQLVNLQYSKLGRLKTYWGVSMMNIVTRAKKLGVINESRARSLYVQLSSKGYISQEPFALPPEEATLIAQGIRVHVLEHGYSLTQLADAMLITIDDLTARFGDYLPHDTRLGQLRTVSYLPSAPERPDGRSPNAAPG